jgi:archaemetzincin
MQERIAATKLKNDNHIPGPALASDNPKTFPGPLVLPGDEIAEDPEYPPQSLQEWVDEEDRNPVTPKRRTVYVVPPPQISDDVDFLKTWSQPKDYQQKDRVEPPLTNEVHEYLSAFYHGLPVKLMSRSTLRLVGWRPGETSAKSTSKAKSRRPKYVGLEVFQECVRIRVRASKDGVFDGQLNLNDLLDAAIGMLPKDAYALLFLVNHDIYEDENDDFACGRAYGGSRVAVVSSARYNPNLDALESVERLHAWPASHCETYISAFCDAADEDSNAKEPSKSHTKAKQNKGNVGTSTSKTGPLETAISVHRNLPMENLTSSSLSALWLGRICRTASHELGHCFGIDHCMYYACSMQGTASVGEDASQPPYLCPVDLAKILHATSTTAIERYHALLAFCAKPHYKNEHIFAPLAAWIRGRLIELEEQVR